MVSSCREDKSLLPGENNKINIDVLCPNIKYLEHVLVTLTLDAPNRGQIEVAIKSPSGENLAFDLCEVFFKILFA